MPRTTTAETSVIQHRTDWTQKPSRLVVQSLALRDHSGGSVVM